MRRYLLPGVLVVGAVLLALLPSIGGSLAGFRWLLALAFVATALTTLSAGRLRDAALMLASIGFGFAALEGIALVREPPKPVWIDSGLRAPRAFVGFGPPHAGTYAMKEIAPGGRLVFDATATIGDDLLRVVEAPKGEGAVAFFGDSRTFGAGIDDRDTITQAFADLTGRSVPVPNLSFSAWSPAQNLATLQHGLNEDAIRRPRRFVLMTAAWHIERTACKVDFVRGAPRYRLRDGKLVQDGFCLVPGRLHDVLTSFALYRSVVAPYLNRLTKRDVETYMAIVDAFVRLAKEKYGVDTTIIAMPELPGFLEAMGSSEAAYLDALARTGADIVVDPLPTRRDNNPYLIPGDFHPTGLANRYVAKLLRDHLAERWPDLLPEATAMPH